MAENQVSDAIKQIKSVIKTDNVIIGIEETLKALRSNSVKKVFLASNASETMVKDITYYADLAGAEVERLEIPNDELGVVCQKPYSIAVISIRN